ncbi:MAG: protein-L-isoaspartate(D-aspartate) O-methyltransferase [Thermodesulfobacteriota bacterium]
MANNAVSETDSEDEYRSAREKMVRTQLIPRGINDSRVLKAVKRVPRHRFVGKNLADEAYEDRPLYIGFGQTISQPYIVALMTQSLELAGDDKVLEIGTGSGYQAAILAELSKHVYTIERVQELLERAEKVLKELGYANITLKAFNGTTGWEEQAPFDAIIVTAGAPEIPQPLLDQLAEGGRLVIPVGDRLTQALLKLVRTKKGFFKEDLGPVRFVSLKGVYGWDE